MDLGIAGRKAIVCASSRGLGARLRMRLAEAGCEVVVNGRDDERLEATAAEIRKATGAKVTAGRRRRRHPRRPEGAVRRLPGARHPGQQQCRPALPRFPRTDRQQMIDGVIANMIVAVELVQKAIDPMIEKKFGRIVNITSGSVRMPLAGLDLSSGARAGLTAFIAGVARSVAQHNVTINFLLPGAFDTDRLRSNIETNAKKQSMTARGGASSACDDPGQALRQPRRVRRDLRVPVLGAGRLHRRPEHPDRRRRLPGSVLGLPEACRAALPDPIDRPRHREQGQP